MIQQCLKLNPNNRGLELSWTRKKYFAGTWICLAQYAKLLRFFSGRKDSIKTCCWVVWCWRRVYWGRNSWRGWQGCSSKWNAQVRYMNFTQIIHQSFVGFPVVFCFCEQLKHCGCSWVVFFHPVRSIFCLNPAGDTPSSARLFDAIVSGCIPVIVSDELELPFEGIIDYRKVWTRRCLVRYFLDILVFHVAICTRLFSLKCFAQIYVWCLCSG